MNFHSIFSTVTSYERNVGYLEFWNFNLFQILSISVSYFLVGGHVLFVRDTYIGNLCLAHGLHFLIQFLFYPHCQVCEYNYLLLLLLL